MKADGQVVVRGRRLMTVQRAAGFQPTLLSTGEFIWKYPLWLELFVSSETGSVMFVGSVQTLQCVLLTRIDITYYN